MTENRTIYLGNQPVHEKTVAIKEGFVEREGDTFYRIENYGAMEPFFMTISSDTNHWMFLSSTGGLTAGRINAESALFPYYTDDRIRENASNTGPRTEILVTHEGKTSFWRPFDRDGAPVYKITSALMKNIRGNRVIFEEINETLGLSFSYSWMNSRRFGWVRKSVLANLRDSSLEIEILDGVRNVLPAGVTSKIQNTFGNLLDAYKKSEIDKESSMGIFALSATLTDLAEPSESLKANVLWSCGLEADFHLLSERQLPSFGAGQKPAGEWENKGERGCYFLGSSFGLAGREVKSWYIAADTDKDHCNVVELKNMLTRLDFDGTAALEEDIARGNANLDGILMQNDASQNSASRINCVHHQANVMYNIMRGGYFFLGNTIPCDDLAEFISSVSISAGIKYGEAVRALGKEAEYDAVLRFVLEKEDGDLLRIWLEYLPLSFSRRHGDPSRPWNVFSIETEKKDGKAKLDYQGNWRDIFQNWEALGYSYPLYIRHFIAKFLNATTADGYNPYRVSRTGIDWEVPEPGNPWANIGYWSDHQIIYLLKLLEMYRSFFGDALNGELRERIFTFAHVPYEIRSFRDILKNPHDTIVFNEKKHREILERTASGGSEGKMLHYPDGTIVLANMTEKLLILLLAKLGNFIPGGGIWMNTQRPEWNDANNALVGKGISIVTLAYLRRYLAFLIGLYESGRGEAFALSARTARWFRESGAVLGEIESIPAGDLTPEKRFALVSELGLSSEAYRKNLYSGGFDPSAAPVRGEELLSFFETALRCADATLRENRREDGLYHSYNTLKIGGDTLEVEHLYEMLEGQVAVLSSGLLTPEEAVGLLKAMKSSPLYREDQNSYMLYPDRKLPGFLEKNSPDREKGEKIRLFKVLLDGGNRDLVCRDVNGGLHFNGDFRNVRQVIDVLEKLKGDERYRDLVEEEGGLIEELFEETFDHRSFTGRSGTFFAYEGLGSIYWHMVSKLLLAVQENFFSAVQRDASPAVREDLRKIYYDVRSGIGYNKSARTYGAFPYEPYSHTPGGKGARQPGMTGQVKEEVITRLAETGVRIREGQICFDGSLLDGKELHGSPTVWSFGDRTISLPANSLGFTFCMTPVVLSRGTADRITLHFSDGSEMHVEGPVLPRENSMDIYRRNGNITLVEVSIK